MHGDRIYAGQVVYSQIHAGSHASHPTVCADLFVHPASPDQYLYAMFSKKLKALRKQLHLTQKEMGKRLAMQQPTYSRKERNNNPDPEFLGRIKKFLGVDPDPWLNNEEDEAGSADNEALRIVHSGSGPGGVGKRKKKGSLSKTESRTLRQGFEFYLLALQEKLARSKKRKPNKSGGGG